MNVFEEFKKGLSINHPIFNMLLGLCSTLAVSIRVVNAIAMGAAFVFVLTLSNFVISLMRNRIPRNIHLPAFLIVIAGFVTIVEVTLKGFYPDVHKALGIYLPLITVNCIVLARAESFASRNSPVLSAADGLGMALGYAYGILVIAFIREILGTGGLALGSLSVKLSITPLELLVLPPGGFLVMGLMLAFLSFRKRRTMRRIAQEVI